MSLRKWRNLQITGPVSVQPVTEKLLFESFRFMIMGPTGAGKSSFIEALAGESNGLNISGDQLASVTQKVAAYELIHVRRRGLPVYIVDTPGFSDSKISEGEIVGMVEKWAEENGHRIQKILFLIPINMTRIEGTKRRTIKMMSELLDGNLGGLVFVTTMWDQLATESAQQRADSNFTQLENDILKGYMKEGAILTKFKNNQSSALEALDKGNLWGLSFRSGLDLFYHDLHERISMSLQEKQMIEEQQAYPNNNDILNAILEHNHAENEDLLVKFIGQLRKYEQPPDGYEDAHGQLLVAISELGDDLQQRVEKTVQEQRQVEVERQERLAREREQRFALERQLSFRVRRKIQHVATSISDIFKPAY